MIPDPAPEVACRVSSPTRRRGSRRRGPAGPDGRGEGGTDAELSGGNGRRWQGATRSGAGRTRTCSGEHRSVAMRPAAFKVARRSTKPPEGGWGLRLAKHDTD